MVVELAVMTRLLRVPLEKDGPSRACGLALADEGSRSTQFYEQRLRDTGRPKSKDRGSGV